MRFGLSKEAGNAVSRHHNGKVRLLFGHLLLDYLVRTSILPQNPTRSTHPPRRIPGLQTQAPFQVIAAAHKRHNTDRHEHHQDDTQIEIKLVRMAIVNGGRQRRMMVMLQQHPAHCNHSPAMMPHHHMELSQMQTPPIHLPSFASCPHTLNKPKEFTRAMQLIIIIIASSHKQHMPSRVLRSCETHLPIDASTPGIPRNPQLPTHWTTQGTEPREEIDGIGAQVVGARSGIPRG
ncbi:hypothetical protein M758_8G061800 [Ceratodon purpureus]|nr:hypothetical protein M758_8G061800 [Ceratodon purpureus]